MKLILTQEVSGLGAPGDVVEVKDGYGRNYLMPRGLAIAWTKGGEKQIDSIKKARAVREIRDSRPRRRDQGPARGAQRAASSAQAGASGRLFGAVTVADIARRRQGCRWSRRRQAADRGGPADQVGGHPPGHGARSTPSVTATVTLEVVAS